MYIEYIQKHAQLTFCRGLLYYYIWPIFFAINSKAMWQLYDCLNALDLLMEAMGKIIIRLLAKKIYLTQNETIQSNSVHISHKIWCIKGRILLLIPLHDKPKYVHHWQITYIYDIWLASDLLYK